MFARLHNLSVKSRLSIAILTLCAVTLVISVISLLMLRNAENWLETIHRDTLSEVSQALELSRTLDYLEERDDINTSRLGFYGFSWGGGCLAPIVLTVEAGRFHAAVLNVGGLESAYRFLPEVDGINFVTRVRTPVLMINGEFDIDVPYETSQIPTYKLLGTEVAHKKLVTAPTAHLVPHDILIRESLDWFDRYLGDSAD